MKAISVAQANAAAMRLRAAGDAQAARCARLAGPTEIEDDDGRPTSHALLRARLAGHLTTISPPTSTRTVPSFAQATQRAALARRALEGLRRR